MRASYWSKAPSGGAKSEETTQRFPGFRAYAELDETGRAVAALFRPACALRLCEAYSR